MLKEFYDMKEEIKISNDKYKSLVIYQKFKLYIKQCYRIVCSVEKTQKVKTQKL